MKTIADNLNFSPEEKLRMMKEYKGGAWYYGWKPYCVQYQKPCSSPRMVEMPYGHRCPDCGNMIGWDGSRLKESPLNSVTELEKNLRTFEKSLEERPDNKHDKFMIKEIKKLLEEVKSSQL